MKKDKYISTERNAKLSQAQIKARLKNRSNSYYQDHVVEKTNEFDSNPKTKMHDFFQEEAENKILKN